ncbi:MAG: excinuclease ABC subunit A, partial [Rhodospirillaceae bacterium]
VKHDISVVVDRLVIRDKMETRLVDSLETAVVLADGLIYVENADRMVADSDFRTVFSTRFACPVSGFTLDEIEPRLFSFNSPFGACPDCDGLGVKLRFDPDLVVPDPTLSLAEGAIAPWAGATARSFQQNLESVARHHGVAMTTPFADLPAAVCHVLLFGSGPEAIPMLHEAGIGHHRVERPFESIIPHLERRWKDSAGVRDELSRFQTSQPCAACGGKRLQPAALTVKIEGRDIIAATDLSITEAVTWFDGLETRLGAKARMIARRILREINDRLRFLMNVGLEYLTLSRASGTLSGGESQRIRLASQIGSGLTGVLYVLDEPSIGLHQRDNDRLLTTLKRLRDLGNTVIVVEHDGDAMRTADHLIDMGPGAGIRGGHVVAAGTYEQVMTVSDSLTGQYLRGVQKIPVGDRRRSGNGRILRVVGARANNLQNITVEIPLGTLTCVTGVSGSGKSTLVIETLYRALVRMLHVERDLQAEYDCIEGIEHIDKIVDIDQSPISRTPRSNPATYTGLFTATRDWFAALPEARARGYKPGRFSFNVKGGRCEACQGDGVLKIEMHFLPDIYIQCNSCKGRRYNRETLEIAFRGKSIADVLDLTVEEAEIFFEAVPAIRDKLLLLQQVGLGYIHLGQQATTLSGGEAQRVKLAKELSRRATGRTLYILDEPTTGLHFEDVRRLLKVLHALVDNGNSVLVIEHNLEVIKTADWIIDLGPEGGKNGGCIVACGSPEDVVRYATGYTARYLAPYLTSDDSARRLSCQDPALSPKHGDCN